ncbi:ATP-binding cassette domain-containing protein [Enterococcus sp. CSURQ0835]|uniref:ATP-binding cassette domain-containing protein n=1 Tax=Enterococcus sp. CSURQ0835 TaxID=2681394 RepID=UPI001357ED90|nr:ABC transporter ATP-binding protein [Enterococcus sp. CSURQ0835]
MLKKIIFKNIHKEIIVILFIMIILSSGIKLQLPSIISSIIDLANKNKSLIELPRLVIWGISYSIIGFLLSLCIEKIRLHICQKVSLTIYRETLKNIFNKKNEFYLNKNITELMNNLDTDINAIVSLFNDTIIWSAISIFLLFGGIFFIFKISPILLLVIIISVGIKLLAIILTGKKQEEYQKISFAFHDSWYKSFSNLMGVVLELKNFRTHPKAIYNLSNVLINRIRIENKISIVSKLTTDFVLLIDEISNFIVYFIGIWLVSKYQLTVGELFSLSIYLSYVSNPIGLFSSTYLMIKTVEPSFNRLNKLLNTLPESSEGKEIFSIENIQLDTVSFSIGKKVIFRKATFCINKGEKVLIVGENGCGKSTLIKILLGVNKCIQGKVLINGEDINNINMSSLWSNLSYIKQEASLMDDTINNNIILYRDAIGEDALFEVIRQLGLEQLIEKKGLNFKVGEYGRNLSGGEKQKIILGRNLIEKKDLIIMDEAFSNVEKKYETEFIEKGLSLIEKDRIILFVSHDLSYIHLFDKILFISEDKIICDIPDNILKLKEFTELSGIATE